MPSDLASYLRTGAVALAMVAAAGLALSTLPAVFGPRSQEASSTSPLEADSDSRPLYSCIDKTRKAIKSGDTDYDLYERIWRLCGNQVYNQMYLADFTIRREKLVRQELDERVTLWMVVSITLSGVILAGLQLLTSYKLASSNHSDLARDSEVVIQRDRISLKSSITGVLILGISLAFFIVYVLWIYNIKEISVDRPENLQPAPSSVSAIGGLGPPPATAEGGGAAISPIQNPPASVSAGRTSGHKSAPGSGRPQ
jgi:hypothetical protein